MLKGVIFDFDGTLADSEPGYFRNFVEMIEEQGYTCSPEDKKYMTGKGTVLRTAYLNEKYGYHIDGEAMRKEFRERNETYLKENAEHLLYDDTLDCLRACKQRGLFLYICSNTKGEVIEEAIAKMGIADYFEGVVSGQDEDLNTRKPDPAVYQKILDRYGLKKEEVLAIEDSDGGVASAKNAGIITVGLTRLTSAEDLKADISISSLRELPDIIDHLNTIDSHMNL